MFMFVKSLFIVTKSCKQPKCSTAGEWINKLWYMHRMDYDSVTKVANYQYTQQVW